MNSVCKSLVLFALVSALSASVAAQSRRTLSNDEASTESNQTFELNISDRHIHQSNYDVGTSVQLNEAALWLLVGVALHADVIDVQLHNVTGTVRFRASLQSVIDVLNQRPSTSPRRVLQRSF